MNAGTRRGGASGIRLGSLLQIVQTKGRDRKTTVLDYVRARRPTIPSLRILYVCGVSKSG